MNWQLNVQRNVRVERMIFLPYYQDGLKLSNHVYKVLKTSGNITGVALTLDERNLTEVNDGNSFNEQFKEKILEFSMRNYYFPPSRNERNQLSYSTAAPRKH